MEHPSHFPDERPYPLQRHLPFVLANWSKNYCRLELTLSVLLMKWQGKPHGRVYAKLADKAMGYTSSFAPKSAPPHWAIMLILNGNYLPQCKNNLLISTANRTGSGNRTFSADALISDNLSTKITSATSIFLYRSSPP